MVEELEGTKIIHALSTTEENAHDESMRESDLDAIDQPISGPFKDGKIVMILWVFDYRIDDF